MDGADFEDPFDLVGDVLDGQFRVDRFAGEGDFTVVYRGHHLGVDAPVAIKCLNVPPTLDAALLEPFLESFRDGARLHYRLALGNLHIARSIAFGTTMAPRTGQSVPYLVREWLEGCSLAADFADRAKEGLKPRTIREVVALLDSAAEALSYAHAQGVVHHSINPRNLFVVPTVEGRVVKVLDFGVAKLLNEQSVATGTSDVPPAGSSGSAPPPAALPLAGLRVMFPSYCAPEQLDRRFGTPGAATDVYALALVIYEALSGAPVIPHNMLFADVLRTFQPSQRPTAHSLGVTISSHAEAVLSRALSLEPSLRHGNASDFWRDLRAAVREDSSIKIRPRTSAARGPRGARRRPDTPPPSSTRPIETPSAMSTAVASSPPVFMGPSPPRIWLLPAIGGAALAIGALLWGGVLFFRAVPHQPARTTAENSTLPATSSLSASLPAPPPAPAPDLPSAPPTATATPTLTPTPAPNTTPSTTPDAETETAQAARPVRRRETFPREEAVRAFDQVAADLSSCAASGGPRGAGSIRARFDNDGTILHVTLGPPYAGTSVGACIAQRFEAVTVTPFQSPSVAFNYVFNSLTP